MSRIVPCVMDGRPLDHLLFLWPPVAPVPTGIKWLQASMDARGQESRTLQSIVGRESSMQEFFERVWQKQCKIYRNTAGHPEAQSNGATTLNEDSSPQSPLKELVKNSWPALLSLLHEARGRFHEYDSEEDTKMVPILFRNGHSVSPEPYGSGDLFHAYLDGCSVVINHADRSCPQIARLCLDLQTSFPHVYANTYVTPPNSQAVPPHADDRDVFIIQLVGKKQWKVYQTVPIPVRTRNEMSFSVVYCLNIFILFLPLRRVAVSVPKRTSGKGWIGYSATSVGWSIGT